MFQKKTLMILGAGASQECGLPTGHDLKTRIADFLDIRFEHGYNLISGDRTICGAFEVAVQREGGKDINPHIHAAWRIRDAMPQAISIDNYVDVNPGDKKLELCGKLGIVRAILEAEQRSRLYVDPTSHPQRMDHEALTQTWFTPFFQLLAENCRPDALEERLANIALVIFNYDRCFEHYLFHALQNYYKFDQHRAADLVKKITIFHPYGTVGALPWCGGNPAAEFGAEPNARLLFDLAGGIKTFTEGTDPNASEIVTIRKFLAGSHIVVFMGFAYHRLNLRLLATDGLRHDALDEVRYIGTAKGMSQSDSEVLVEELEELAGASPERIRIRTDLTCSGLLREYWRTLSHS